MKIQRFEDLECWEEARTLLKMIYEAINSNEKFQKDYRLSNQITGACISVMNNIAEGWGSQSNPEFIRFLTYSRRSCIEVQNCLYPALDQQYINDSRFNTVYQQSTKTLMIIDGLLRYLRSQRSKRPKQT